MEIALPKVITYKEIMVVYGYNLKRAQDKLWYIRSSLGKQRHQSILIAEFCKAENVEREIFEGELLAAYQKFYSKPSKALTLFP